MIQEIIPGKIDLGPEIPWQILGVVREERVKARQVSFTRSAIRRVDPRALNRDNGYEAFRWRCRCSDRSPMRRIEICRSGDEWYVALEGTFVVGFIGRGAE